MDIRSLQLFLHLSQTLHFAQTAKQMYVSPSTLSRCISRLEQELGHTLLIRDNRSAKLTHEGLVLANFCRTTLGNWHQLKEELSSKAHNVRGKLTLFCSVTAVYSHLPGILEKVRQAHPNIEIQLTTGDPDDAIDLIQQKKCDLAITAHPIQLGTNIYFYDLDTIPLDIIAPTLPGNINDALNQPEIDWNNIPFILPEHGAARVRIDNWFQEMNISPNIYATVRGHEALVSMVAIGCGLGIAPSVVIDNSPVKHKIKNISTAATLQPFQLGICTLTNRLQQRTVKAVLDCLRN